MEVTQTSAEGLKRELRVVIPQDELGTRFVARLDAVKQQIQLKGFRKGKVPFAHVKKLYGRSVMAEVLEEAVTEISQQVLSDRKERAAHQPKIVQPVSSDARLSLIRGVRPTAAATPLAKRMGLSLQGLAATLKRGW